MSNDKLNERIERHRATRMASQIQDAETVEWREASTATQEELFATLGDALEQGKAQALADEAAAKAYAQSMKDDNAFEWEPQPQAQEAFDFDFDSLRGGDGEPEMVLAAPEDSPQDPDGAAAAAEAEQFKTPDFVAAHVFLDGTAFEVRCKSGMIMHYVNDFAVSESDFKAWLFSSKHDEFVFTSDSGRAFVVKRPNAAKAIREHKESARVKAGAGAAMERALWNAQISKGKKPDEFRDVFLAKQWEALS